MDPSQAVTPYSYDPAEVVLSVIIAVAASYAALDLAGRVRAARGSARAVWLACGAISLGSGIWAMHFVGMLAFHLPVTVFYHWPTVLAAWVIAIFASAAALYIVKRDSMGMPHVVIGGIILGCGVSALHYMGMWAMRMAAATHFNPVIVAASVLLGIVFAVGGLWLGCKFRTEPEQRAWKRLGGAILMGTAIAGMHYTGMASATYTASSAPVDLAHTVYVSTLGSIGIAAVILLLLAVTIVCCLLNRRFDTRRFQLAVAEAKLELAQVTRQTVMGELTASIAHEIKQPLAAIMTNANYCLRQLAGATPNLQEVRDAIQEIIEDGNRTNSIISRIRALLMKGSSETVPLDLNDVVREVVRLAGGETEQNRINLKLELAEDLVRIPGDRVQLQQAVINVVMNSIESLRAAPAHRELLIRTRRGAEGIVLEVRDSGPGLDPRAVERLFEPFFTTKAEGMGLGLSISRSIIESHGGRLSNVATSSGAHFEFIFPTGAESSPD
ncbi:MAG: MHYT domain-containing protein [Acidobacteriaceae bacterium]